MDVARFVDPGRLVKISRDAFMAMIDAGAFKPDERIELLDGVLVAKSPQKDRHALTVVRTSTLLSRLVAGRAEVATQLPFNAGEYSRPESDVALWPPDPRRIAVPDRMFLVVEVADSSVRVDRAVKAAIYAAAKVPEYWIINLVDDVVERYSQPRRGRYGKRETLERGALIRLVALPELEVAVAELLPPDPS